MYSRRHFLRAALLGGGLLPLAALAPSLLVQRALAATGPSEGQSPLARQSQLFMGTVVSLTVANAPEARATAAMEQAFAQGRALEAVFTRFAPGSPVSQLNAQGRLADAPPALGALLERAAHLGRLTSGAFDVTVLPLLRLLEARRNPQGTLHLDQGEVRQALDLVGQEGLRQSASGWHFARQGMGATLDGIAKGHIADVMSQALTAAGCPEHLVNAGGDMVVRGRKGAHAPWRVAVEDPRKQGRYPQVLEVTGGIATSGGYEVFYDAARKHSHLLHPTSGRSPSLAGVTVTAADGLTADALATALAVMPPRDALALADALPTCACCLLLDNGLTQVSARWKGRAA